MGILFMILLLNIVALIKWPKIMPLECVILLEFLFGIKIVINTCLFSHKMI